MDADGENGMGHATEAPSAQGREGLHALLGDLAVMDWLSLDAGIAAIARTTAAAIDVRRVSVWRYDDEGAAMHCVALWQDGDCLVEGTTISRTSHPVYWSAIHAARSLAIDDALASPLLVEFRDDYLRPLGIGALLDTSIRADGRSLGLLCVEHLGGPRAWTAAERDFIASLGDRVALLLVLEERRALEQRLREAHAMEAVGVLAGGIAHDFNNVLGIIGSAAALLGAQLDAEHPGQEEVEAILDATTRATALVRKLLRVGRCDPMTRHRLDLRETLAAFRPMAARLVPPAVRLTWETAAAPLWVEADPTFVEQALLNLVANAVQAMPAGGTLTLAAGTVEAAPPPTTDCGAHTGTTRGYATITVRDDGAGMSPAQLARIFEPFFTTKGDDGTGLGLSVVYGGMRQHDGFVTAQSAPGQGAAFVLHFPVATGDATA